MQLDTSQMLPSGTSARMETAAMAPAEAPDIQVSEGSKIYAFGDVMTRASLYLAESKLGSVGLKAGGHPNMVQAEKATARK